MKNSMLNYDLYLMSLPQIRYKYREGDVDNYFTSDLYFSIRASNSGIKNCFVVRRKSFNCFIIPSPYFRLTVIKHVTGVTLSVAVPLVVSRSVVLSGYKVSVL